MQAHKVINVKDHNNKDYFVRVANNQKVIQIHREKGINFDSNYEAIKTLSTNAYVLYMYMLMHSSNRIWALSSQEVFDNTPLKKRTYMNAMKELQDAKYLTPGVIDLNNGEVYDTNTYHLWENPKMYDPASSSWALNQQCLNVTRIIKLYIN